MALRPVPVPALASIQPASEQASLYHHPSDARCWVGLLVAVRFSYPIENGIVRDWKGMVNLYDYTFYERLKIKPEERKILLTEPPMNRMCCAAHLTSPALSSAPPTLACLPACSAAHPSRVPPTAKENQRKMLEMMLEKYQFESAKVGVQAMLVLYAQGLLTGVVVDSGDGVTHIVPVWEGVVPQLLIKRLDVAGRHITRYLIKLLQVCLCLSPHPLLSCQATNRLSVELSASMDVVDMV